jgi:hypothetical protein
MLRAGPIVFLSLIAALMLVGVAGAANSASFSDPAGDSGSAPDITNVSITSDDSGMLTFQVTLGNRSTTLNSDDGVFVNLDLDQNPDTGSVSYGTEAALGLEGAKTVFLRPDSAGRDMTDATPPASLQGSFSAGVATFSVSASDLGLSPTGGFNVWVHTENDSTGEEAPDIRTINYQLVPGTAPLALGPDMRAPYDQAFRANGKRGHVVHLDYSAADGRGQTADVVRVFNKGHVIKTFAYRLEDTDPFGLYYAKWHAPRKINGPLKFCVVSTDAAGNKSNTACAPIKLG